MKRFPKRTVLACASLIAVVAGAWWLWDTPRSYREYPLNPYALHEVHWSQRKASLTAEECAVIYHYHGIDESELAPGAKITTKTLSDSSVRVTIHEPIVQDDSIHETIARIYLSKDSAGYWVPSKQEHAHKGRGRLGWTTEPTS